MQQRNSFTFSLLSLCVALPGVVRPTITPATIMAPPTVATVAPVIPPPGIAIPQTLTRPPAIIQPIPGQAVVIPPPSIVAPTIVTPVVSILPLIENYYVFSISKDQWKSDYLLATGHNYRKF